MSSPREPNPFQTFLLALSLAATLPLLRGDTGSAALESAVSDRTVIAWGLTLGLGSAAALAGQWWPRSEWTGWILERLGLSLVACAAAVYAIVIYEAAGDVSDVRYAAFVQVAYALACLVRARQLSKRIKRAKTAMAATDG